MTDLRHLVIPLPGSGKGLNEEERVEALDPKIGGFVSNALRKSGFLVNDSDFSIQALQNNLKMSNLVDSLRASHEVLVRQMSLRPKDTKKGRYSLGKSVADLNLPSSADVVAIVYARQSIYGRGENKWIALDMSFADAQTGEILCYFRTRGNQEKSILEDLKRVPH